jgi:hypothetical protein
LTKFLLGVAVGYVLSDMIDEFLGKKTAEDVKLHKQPSSEPSTTPPTTPPDPAAQP